MTFIWLLFIYEKIIIYNIFPSTLYNFHLKHFLLRVIILRKLRCQYQKKYSILIRIFIAILKWNDWNDYFVRVHAAKNKTLETSRYFKVKRVSSSWISKLFCYFCGFETFEIQVNDLYKTYSFYLILYLIFNNPIEFAFKF